MRSPSARVENASGRKLAERYIKGIGLEMKVSPQIEPLYAIITSVILFNKVSVTRLAGFPAFGMVCDDSAEEEQFPTRRPDRQ